MDCRIVVLCENEKHLPKSGHVKIAAIITTIVPRIWTLKTCTYTYDLYNTNNARKSGYEMHTFVKKLKDFGQIMDVKCARCHAQEIPWPRDLQFKEQGPVGKEERMRQAGAVHANENVRVVASLGRNITKDVRVKSEDEFNPRWQEKGGTSGTSKRQNDRNVTTAQGSNWEKKSVALSVWRWCPNEV